MRSLSVVGLAGLLAAQISCRTGLPLPIGDQSEGGSASSGNVGGDGGDTNGTGGTPSTGTGGEGGAPPADPSAIWVSDATTLFKFDRVSSTFTAVGDFDCTGAMTDLAVDAAGNLFGVGSGASASTFYAIDPLTAACKEISSLAPGPYVGSFTAATDASGAEALLAISLQTWDNVVLLLQLNPSTGDVGILGAVPWYPGTTQDLVADDNGVLYALTHAPEDAEGDAQHLVLLDPNSGALEEDRGALPIGLGPSGFEQLAGLAFKDGTLLGFSDVGRVYVIDPQGPTLTQLEVQGGPNSFTGAAAQTFSF